MKYLKVTIQNDAGDAFTFEQDGAQCKVTLDKKFRAIGYMTLSHAGQVMAFAKYFFGQNPRGHLLATNSDVQELRDLVEKFLP